jgi:histidyl-tRNA synthetase
MLKVSGFPELLPEEKIVEEKILSSIKNKYQQFGYTLIETPAVERNEVLLAK